MTLLLNKNSIEIVSSFKHLGVHVGCHLNWNAHIVFLCGCLAQRLHFLRRLRLFGVSTEMMWTSYVLVDVLMLESIVRYGISVWNGHLTVATKKMKLVNMVNTAMKVIGTGDISFLQFIYECSVAHVAYRIIYISHPVF